MPHPQQRCAYCRQHLAIEPYVPFCSERCKSADLGLWLTGGYRAPATITSPTELDELSALLDDERLDAPSEENH